MSTRPKSSATSSSADLPGLPRLGTEIFAGDLTMTVGGNAIVAAGLPHRLGAKVGLAADRKGPTLSSLIVRQTLDELGLDRSLIREHESTRCHRRRWGCRSAGPCICHPLRPPKDAAGSGAAAA
ncbi:MAG: hypothetical protein R2873_34905 [Caldilineaceae bacterium]